MHLGMNMYALFVLGPLLERMWGRAAFLAIYLLSCIGGGAFAVVLTPHAYLVGASGAICGLLGSMLTWLALNKGHLPDHIVANWQRNILVNIVLIAVISFLPGVSWAGHLGGGLTGAVVGIPLNVAHFGEGRKKWLGWLGALVLTAIGILWLHFLLNPAVGAAIQGSEEAGMAEIMQANKRELPALLQAEELASTALKLEAKVFNAAPKRIDDPTAKDIRAKLLNWQIRLDHNAAALAKAGPIHQPELAATIKTGLDFLQASSQLCGKTAKALEPEGPWPPPDLRALTAEHAHVNELHQTFVDAWVKLKELVEGQ